MNHKSSPARVGASLRYIGRRFLGFAAISMFSVGQLWAAASFKVTPVTWDIMGLDSNNVNVGPNEFPCGVRVTNTGNVTATNVVCQFQWDDTGTNKYLNLTSFAKGTTDTLMLPSLAPGASQLFYYSVTVTRNKLAYGAVRKYHIYAKADGVLPTTFAEQRQIYVEKILSQSRNDVISLTGPTAVRLNDTAQYNLVATTATNGYEQIQNFANFPNRYFRVNQIQAHYTAPSPTGSGFDYSLDYVDACGWGLNSFPLSSWRMCGAATPASPSGKAGGDINANYTLQIVKPIDTTITVSMLIHDYSGSSYHYNSDFGPQIVFIPATDVTIVKTAVPKTVEVGAQYDYFLTAVNIAASPAENVVVTDVLPAGLGFVSSNPSPSTSSGQTQTWNLGTLQPNSSKEIDLKVVGTCGAIPNGSRSTTLVNTATVQTTTEESRTDNNSTSETITLQDTTPPTILCNADVTVNADLHSCSAVVTIKPPYSYDNCSTSTLTGVRSDGKPLTDPYPVGVTTITWTVTDSHTNTAQCVQKVTVLDKEPPSINCPANICIPAVRAQCSATTTITPATATDNCTAVTVKGVREDNLPLTDPYPVGATVITWTAKDTAGNTSTCTQTVKYGVITCN